MNGRTVLTALLASFLLTAAATTQQDALRCNAACGYESFTNASAKGLNTPDGPCRATIGTIPAGGFRLTFRSHNHTDWHLSLVSTQGDTIKLNIKGAEIADAISSQRALQMNIITASDSYDTVLLSEISASGGTNAWQLTHSNGTLTVSAGSKDYINRLTIPLSDNFTPSYIIFDTANKKGALITDLLLMPVTSPHPQPRDIAQLQQSLLRPTQRYEGYWQMLDSEFDESLLRPGGDYRLILVAAENGYDMIYADGARINPGYWQPGMIKGHLQGTPFDGIYDVIWYDAEGKPMSHSLKAQFESDNTLTIQFPYQSSRIRLQRCPAAQ